LTTAGTNQEHHESESNQEPDAENQVGIIKPAQTCDRNAAPSTFSGGTAKIANLGTARRQQPTKAL
jgi:hypothetical protein